tara:strand:+ start:198 stop:410 length:213 start_codon:yes stop_codon:yes gene_type:complete
MKNENENVPEGNYTGGVPSRVSTPGTLEWVQWELASSPSLGTGWPWQQPGASRTNILRRAAANKWKEENV